MNLATLPHELVSPVKRSHHCTACGKLQAKLETARSTIHELRSFIQQQARTYHELRHRSGPRDWRQCNQASCLAANGALEEYR